MSCNQAVVTNSSRSVVGTANVSVSARAATPRVCSQRSACVLSKSPAKHLAPSQLIGGPTQQSLDGALELRPRRLRTRGWGAETRRAQHFATRSEGVTPLPFALMDLALKLPNGTQLDGAYPIVVVGPNGSGKTRQTRELRANVPIEFVNALRNTRVAPELPAMGVAAARNNFTQQRTHARSRHWELTSEFDSMLSQLLAQDSMAAMEFRRRYNNNPESPGVPEETPLTRVEELWSRVFPGRTLTWQDWKPVVTNTVAGSEVEYTGNQMSDGEKAVLFLAGRVFSSDPGILVVDEPETHLHSLLAVRLWNELEDARPDIRFVYVTHDLTFAMSRRLARFVIASPMQGLRVIDLDSTLPEDVAEALLGSASLSFYAVRVVFCEGEETSLDKDLYNAWFNGVDTVVKPVIDCQRVIRCVDSVRTSGIAHSLEAIGIIDRDFHSENYLMAMPQGTHPLLVHEVESLLALPDVVRAVADHVACTFDSLAYFAALRATVGQGQRQSITIQRWKSRIEPHLMSLVSQASSRNTSVEELRLMQNLV
jgi:hypothetical protein